MSTMAKIARRVFLREEMQAAYNKVGRPEYPIRGKMTRLAYAFMLVLAKLGYLEKLKDEFKKPHPAQLALYDEATLHVITNRIHNLPSVIIDTSRKPTINLLVPAFDFASMSAGFFGVFMMGKIFHQCGAHVRVVMFDNFEFDYDKCREKFKNYPGMEDIFDILEVTYIGNRRKPLHCHPDDTSIATVWYSAYMAKKIQQACSQKPFFYLIQDYETQFYPSNSLWAMAEASYAMDYIPIFSTEVLADFFKSRNIGNMVGRNLPYTYFNNACAANLSSKEEFQKNHSQDEKNVFVFYSRPAVNRNMFELGALALIKAVKTGVLVPEQWEFYGIGLGNSSIELAKGLELTQLPRMNLREYQDKIASFDVGLTLMASPHPSLLPADLAGSGTLVVTNNFLPWKTQAYFNKISGNIIAVDPAVDAVVEGIRIAVERVHQLDKRYADAVALTWPRSWEETFNPTFMAFLKGQLGRLGFIEAEPEERQPLRA